MEEHARDCTECQGTLDGAGKLRFKRLGKHERLQLLSAAAPGSPPSPIYPPGPSQSTQTATRRAITSLVEHRLLRIAPEQLRLLPGEADEALAKLARKYAVVRVASRTLLGEEIVNRYRGQLESGERIRWIVHLDAATEAALARCPERAVGVRPPSGMIGRNA